MDHPGGSLKSVIGNQASGIGKGGLEQSGQGKAAIRLIFGRGNAIATLGNRGLGRSAIATAQLRFVAVDVPCRR